MYSAVSLHRLPRVQRHRKVEVNSETDDVLAQCLFLLDDNNYNLVTILSPRKKQHLILHNINFFFFFFLIHAVTEPAILDCIS